MARRSESKVIDNATAQKWLVAYAENNDNFERSGFPPLSGSPIGHFFGIPEIANAASAFAGNIQKRETEKQKVPVSVEYTIHLTNGQIVAEATFQG